MTTFSNPVSFPRLTRSTRALACLGLALALSACEDSPYDLDELDELGEAGTDDTFRAGCTNLYYGVKVCQTGQDIDIYGNDDGNEVEVEMHFNHKTGKAWLRVESLNDGFMCYPGCIWTSPEVDMHPAHIADPNLWYWVYYDIDIKLGQGRDDLYGATKVITDQNIKTVRFLDARAEGQRGDDDIYYVTIVRGGKGDDLIVGTNRADDLRGNEDVDHIYGAAGDDHLEGDENWDALYGQDGDDYLDGGGGNDDCNGGPGDDTKVSCASLPGDAPGWTLWLDPSWN